MTIDDRNARIETADVLTSIGISIPLFFIRLPFMRRKIPVKMTMGRACLYGMIRIDKLRLQIGMTSAEIAALSESEECQFRIDHAKKICEMISLSILASYFKIILFNKVLSFIIMRLTTDRHQMAIARMLGALYSNQAFVDTIRSFEAVNPLEPRLSR